jgi:fructokinase
MSPARSKPRVFGAGLFALDLVVSADAETPVHAWAGGTSGNVLTILSYLGWEAYPIARMNGDSASQRVKADMKKWGVKLDFASCAPTAHTPIIIQEIRRLKNGAPSHRFIWSCPQCGERLPSFKPVTTEAVEEVAQEMEGVSVFFMDRLARSTLMLAASAAEKGAVVFFEPSGKGDPKLFAEAMRIAHIVKYADQRFSEMPEAMSDKSSVLLEIQTLGSEGLQFRHKLGRGVSNWRHIAPFTAPALIDTCGSGDWCTAGIIAHCAEGGLEGLRKGGVLSIQSALSHGQAMAAWNCGFEGARGGMYAVDRTTFHAQITALVKGKPEVLSVGKPKASPPRGTVPCPACPPKDRRSTRATAHR